LRDRDLSNAIADAVWYTLNAEVNRVEIRMLMERVAGPMRDWRRHLHMYPELSFEEHETARYIAAVLAGTPGSR
jgi:hypothetical protein